MYKSTLKPILDFCLALTVFVLFFPILLFTAIALYILNDKQVFFFQTRPGLHGKLFKIIKFKTMNDRKDASGQLLPDAQRLTKLGSFIRKTSIDELPQLINVLKGDISLVGPRPLLVEYLPLYSSEQSQRHLVKPGITGYAQVNGRNAISWQKKFELDIYYVQNISFYLDLQIMFKTVLNVLRSKDINSETAATMEKFTGNHPNTNNH
jgi:undecaprenyl phosphate N,N'-diacetylbacillosamine 1-phosphate transferase